MDATYRSTQSPYAGASPTQLVGDKLALATASSKVEAHEKNQVLAAALSEYCRLKDDGVAPQIDEFCQQFPTYHKSIQRMIDVEETLDKMDVDDVQWPEVGSCFMGFDVLHELGVGAFARVYLATEPALGGRLVAVKVAMYGSDEAETLGKLVHPNVVPVHSVRDDSESGMTAVCMPYLGSATLSDVIEQVFQDGMPQSGSVILRAVERREVVGANATSLPAAEADASLRRGNYVDAVTRLGIQMAEALVYTHDQGVLHRDLKPSNVLITPTGQPKLLDFNLSCDVETEVNRLGGTLPYMPPEQINDVFLRPFDAQLPTDPRSDIFSLGVILYELFTGELPFGNPPSNISPIEAGKIYLQAQQSPPRPVQSINPRIDPQTAQVIERCISPNPAYRPANAAELVAELSDHFSLPRKLRRWSLANKGALVGIGAIFFAALVALTVHLSTRPSLDRRLYNKGLAAMEGQEYEDAIEYLDEAFRLNKNQPAIRLARGICYARQDNNTFAREDFAAVGAGDCDLIVKEVYAFSFFSGGAADYRAGGIWYAELAKACPENLDLKINEAYAKYFATMPGEAKRLAKEILAIDPYCQPAHHIRAMCANKYLTAHNHGDPTSVLQDYETALAVGPSCPYLEIDRLRILSRIAQNDPLLQPAFAAELKSRLERIAPQLHFQMLESAEFKMFAAEPWFVAAKSRCQVLPIRTRQSYIIRPPSEAATWEYLRRRWTTRSA